MAVAALWVRLPVVYQQQVSDDFFSRRQLHSSSIAVGRRLAQAEREKGFTFLIFQPAALSREACDR